MITSSNVLLLLLAGIGSHWPKVIVSDAGTISLNTLRRHVACIAYIGGADTMRAQVDSVPALWNAQDDQDRVL